MIEGHGGVTRIALIDWPQQRVSEKPPLDPEGLKTNLEAFSLLVQIFNTAAGRIGTADEKQRSAGLLRRDDIMRTASAQRENEQQREKCSNGSWSPACGRWPVHILVYES